MSNDLVPPHSLDAEQALLGAIFLDNDVIDDAVRLVSAPYMFYRQAHREIYSAMGELRANNANIDWVTVADLLAKKGVIEECGGEDYLEEITAATPVSEGAEQYAEIVRDKFVLRNTAYIGDEVRKAAFDPTARAQGPLAEAIERLQKLQAEILTPTRKSDDTQDAIAWYESLADPEGDQTIFCGHPVIDDIAMGFNRGGLSQFIAPSGSGKTFFLHQLCMRIRRECGILGGMVQGEMKAARLLARQAVGKRGMLAAHNKRRGTAGARDEGEFERAIERMRKLGENIYPIRTPKSMSIQDVSQSVKELAAKGSRFVVIDYLQRIHGGQREANADLKYVVTALKDLARNLDIHICCASQIPVSTARDKERTVWDFTQWDAYGGASAVNDFDMIATVFRPGILPDARGGAIRNACGSGWPVRADQITVVKVCKSRFGEKDCWALWVGRMGDEDLTIEPMSGEMSTAFKSICQLKDVDSE